MNEYLATINQTIINNKPLLVAIGVPVLTALAAAIVSLVTTRMNLKAQKLDRELQKQLWLLDVKRQKLDEFRKLLAEFETVAFSTSFEISSGLSSGKAGHMRKEVASSAVFQIIRFMAEINLLIMPSDPEGEALNQAMKNELKFITDKDLAKKTLPENRFAAISSRIIARQQAELFTESAK